MPGVSLDTAGVRMQYEAWLKESTLDALFYVRRVEKIDSVLSITLFGTLDDTRLLSSAWKVLDDSLKKVKSSLPGILFYQLSKTAEHPPSRCIVKLSSRRPNTFSGTIIFKYGRIRPSIHYEIGRTMVLPQGLNVRAILPNPQGTLICLDSIDACKTKVKTVIEQFLTEKSISPGKIINTPIGKTYVKYEVEEIEKMITTRYREKLVFEFYFHAIEDKIIEIRYELEGWYASGFRPPWIFRDIREGYYEECVLFYRPFQSRSEDEINPRP